MINPESKPKSLLVVGLTTFVFVTLLIRLMDIQLMNGKTFRALADSNKTYVINHPEERGVLLDRYGDPLVYNKPIYFKLDSDKTLYSERTRISPEESMEVMSQNSDLVRTELERMYLYPESLSHVLGYVGKVSADDLINDSSLKIRDKIGKFGLEKEYQSFLKGSEGSEVFEINAMGEKQHLILEEHGVPGTNIPTTIDPYLSEVAFKAMGENRGAVVILDASNSEVLSLVSTPTFDSSILSESLADEVDERTRVNKIEDFFSNPQQLFFNRAVSGAYPPGSVFKLITSLAGLEGKKIDENTTVVDEGVLEVGEYSYANWYFTQYGGKEGEIGLLRAIARSNDIYFYKVAEWVGPEKLKEMAQLFSLGEKTGIQLQAETEGLVPDPEWKQETIGERWFLGNTYHMGIGQGDILVSPIQIAQMTQAIANHGELCKATLVSDSFNVKNLFTQSRCQEVGVLEENINLVFEGMIDACSTGGTGFPFFEHNESVGGDGLSARSQIDRGAVACKTGTSEFGMPDNRGYRKTHGWFTSVIGTKDLVKNAIESRKASDEEQTDQTDQASDEAEILEEESLVQEEGLEDPTDYLTGLRNKWLDRVEKNGFPEEIVVVVLVESDEVNPYKEGSKDAGPVVKQIFDWMMGDVAEVTGETGDSSEIESE